MKSSLVGMKLAVIVQYHKNVQFEIRFFSFHAQIFRAFVVVLVEEIGGGSMPATRYVVVSSVSKVVSFASVSNVFAKIANLIINCVQAIAVSVAFHRPSSLVCCKCFTFL